MLAAIGIGILAKQVHVMLGVTTISGAPLDILSKVPSTIQYLIAHPTIEYILPAGLGLFSLFLLGFYSKLRSPLFQLIPAPMWVVLIAVGLTYYFELIARSPYPLQKI